MKAKLHNITVETDGKTIGIEISGPLGTASAYVPLFPNTSGAKPKEVFAALGAIFTKFAEAFPSAIDK